MMMDRLENPGLRKSGECAVLLNVLQALGGDINENRGAGFRNENAALLEIRFAAYLAGRVELRSTRTI